MPLVWVMTHEIGMVRRMLCELEPLTAGVSTIIQKHCKRNYGGMCRESDVIEEASS